MPQTTTGTQVLYRALSALNHREGAALFQPATARLAQLLARFADRNDLIPPQSVTPLRQLAGDAISALFVAPTPFSPYPDGRAPYTPGTAEPLAPFARLLNGLIAQSVAALIRGHQTQMARTLPPLTYRWLTSARTPAELPIAEQTPTSVGEAPAYFATRLLNQAYLTQYRPFHEWVDPSGYRLSDRIWRTGAAVRDKADRYLTDSIGRNTPALQMSRDLEQFLLPTRANLRTRRPYGTNASFDAMRLARTELIHAYSTAQQLAATTNPFVTGMDWALSAAHPRVDICDDIATIGMSGERLRPPYPVESCPIPVQASHPQCLCFLLPYIDNTQEPTEALVELHASGAPPPLTPAAPFPFLQLLLGAYLGRQAYRYLNRSGNTIEPILTPEGEFV
ncbi:MAG: hypothetical protein WC683_10135 [bacterium]